MKMNLPVINEEVKLDQDRYIVSETDSRGIITYCNDYFSQISGYSKEELLGSQHNIIRHPDMPRVIFKLLWQHIKAGKNINVVVKNRTKEGKFYWIFTEFVTRVDLDTNTVIGYTAHRKGISEDVTNTIASIYDQVLKVEKEKGMEEAEACLNELLEEKGEDISFENLMEHVHKFY